MRTAGFTANKVLRPLTRNHAKSGGKTGGTIKRITADWKDYAGRFAKLSKPLRLHGTRDGRTLTVEALGPAATLLQADSGSIIERINARLGSDTVQSLRVIQGRIERETPIDAPTKRGLTPTEESQLQSSLSGVGDDGLKAALEALGRNVIGRET